MTPTGIGEKDATPNSFAPRGSRRLDALENVGIDSSSAHGPGPPAADLPVELSSFIGREQEIAEVKRRLGDTRLLTLTGPGGCGKTRLAMAVAFEMVGGFENGVWLAGLAPLSVEQILKRLEDSLKLLAGSDRTAPERQRTLRGTLDWSYDLLSEAERLLFARLSVFAGGWTLEAAEAVGAGDDIEEEDVLDLLSKLVDKSFVVVEGTSGENGLGYRMLEPVRQYGYERLEVSGEAEAVRRRHAEYYLALVEEAEPELREQGAWLESLEAEHANFRAALGWALDPVEDAQEPAGAERAELGLRLAAALAQGRFWNAYCPSESRRWLERGLATGSGAAPPSVRAKALCQTGYLAIWQGDYQQSVALLEESMTLFKDLGANAGVATSLSHLGKMAVHGGDHERAMVLCREAEALLPELVDRQAIGLLLIFLGMAAQNEGDHDRGLPMLEESLALNRELGDMLGTAVCLTGLGIAALEQDDPKRAAALYEEDMHLLRQLRDKTGTAYGLRGMSCVAALQGDGARLTSSRYSAEDDRISSLSSQKETRAARDPRSGCVSWAGRGKAHWPPL